VKTAWRAVQMVAEDSNHGRLYKWLLKTPTIAATAELNVVSEDTNHGGL